MVSSPELLQVKDLTKVYQNESIRRTAFREVNIRLRERDSVAIVGPSGCGKTSLMLVIAGLIPATSGSIQMDGGLMKGPTHKIALVFQESGLFPWKTARENILLGAKMRKTRVSHETYNGLKQELGIEGLDRHYPHQLSGGQRQRVALARALLLKPRLLLLDEPYAALDAFTREHLQNHLLMLFNRREFSFILVTHNIEEAVFLGRRILIMNTIQKKERTVMENPGAGTIDYREAPEYYRQVSLIRKMMKGRNP